MSVQGIPVKGLQTAEQSGASHAAVGVAKEEQVRGAWRTLLINIYMSPCSL